MNLTGFHILAAGVFLALSQNVPALELGAPFADHAVLQRQLPVPVWGWSKPGTEVTVEFAGQKQSATAEENGKWTLSLAPLEASAEPRPMTIAEKGGESRTLNDLLVGGDAKKAERKRKVRRDWPSMPLGLADYMAQCNGTWRACESVGPIPTLGSKTS